jgi:LPPG:FO 2-phospho-L-lactate transferase
VTARYLALSGGVGGAKLVDGLAQVLPPDALTVAVNVGDDFEHLGLPIWPDLDTVLYTLAGKVHPQQGWGRADESTNVMAELRALDGATWFQLGDRDIALHLLRRAWLGEGRNPSEIALELARRLGVQHRILPVTHDPLRTWIETEDGALDFQTYFVARRAQPKVRKIVYRGAENAHLAPGVRAALEDPALGGVILCPSNPYLSLLPMLAIRELREHLCALEAPVIAVSPIVGGEALKGPAAKIMRELGVTPDARITAELYADFLDLSLVDTVDATLVAGDNRFHVAPTVMRSRQDRAELARICLQQIAAFSQRTRR